MRAQTVKVIVAGSRGFDDFDKLRLTLDGLWPRRERNEIRPEIVSGTARGADQLGEEYARSQGLKVHRYPANWKKHGKRAGFVRNAEMADHAEALVAFWDGESRGTRHMIETAQDKGLRVIVRCYLFDDYERIDSFRDPFRWLSNFAPAEVALDGDYYRTVEHAYQAAKFEPGSAMREAVQLSRKPAEAKHLARNQPMRDDFESEKLAIMEGLLEQKFMDPIYRALLRATGSKDLVEGNTWGDTFWGVSGGRGHNHLGRLLMQVRSRIEAQDLID